MRFELVCNEESCVLTIDGRDEPIALTDPEQINMIGDFLVRAEFTENPNIAFTSDE